VASLGGCRGGRAFIKFSGQDGLPSWQKLNLRILFGICPYYVSDLRGIRQVIRVGFGGRGVHQIDDPTNVEFIKSALHCTLIQYPPQ